MANDILVKIGADITDFSRKMAESNKALSNFGKANAETFDAFKKTGAAVTGAGLALAGGLGFAVKTAANFESAMSSVAAISGATGEDFDLLSAKAREMGASTSFSASEAAEGLEYMALAGWNTQQMLGGIEPILHLAEAGALDLGRASDLVTDSMSALGIEVKDLDGYLDKVAKTAASANTDIDALMEAFVIAGGTFERFNVPLEEANAFLGVMANRGFKGSEAGTALNAIMTRLTASTGPSAKALKELGVNAYDSSGNFRGMEVVMKDVEKKLSGLTDKERAHYQTQIAGLNHGKAFSAMLSGLGNEYDDLKDAIIDSDGALIDMRNTMKDNLQGALENLSSAFEEMQIALGSALLPAIKVIVKGLQFLADKFNALPDGVKSFIAIGAALSAVLLIVGGGLLLIVGFIPQIIAGFTAIVTVVKAVIGFFGMLAGAISLPVALIVAAVVGLAIIIYKYWDEIKAFMKATWDAIVEAAIAVWEWIKDVWNSAVEAFVEIFAPLIEIMSEVWENIKVAAEAAWELIKNVVLGPILLLIDLVTGNFDEMGSHLSQIWENIKVAAETIWNSFIDIFSMVWDAIKQVFGNALQWLDNKTGGKFSDIIKVVSEYMDMAFGIIEDIWGFIKRSFSNALEFVKGLVTLDFGRMWNAIKDQMGNIRETISSVWNRIKSFFSGKLSEILSNLKRKFTDMVSAVREKMSEIRDKIEELMKKAIDYLKGIDLLQVGKDIIQGLINGIGSMASAVWNKAKSIASGIGDTIKRTLGVKSPSRVLMEIGKWTSVGLADGIEDYAYLVDKASDMLAESAIPDVKNIDMSYATPDGVTARSLAGAVSGTVDVNSRDDRLIIAIGALERRLTNLEVVMDGRKVGRIVEPYVTENQERNDYVKKLTK